jgi:hypothetical protein
VKNAGNALKLVGGAGAIYKGASVLVVASGAAEIGRGGRVAYWLYRENMQTETSSARQSGMASYCWIGAGLIFVLLEAMTMFSQYRKHPSGLPLRFFFVPVMLTLPFSAIAPLYLDVKSGKYAEMSESERGRLNFTVSFAILMAYVTLLICVGEFL